MTVGCGILGDKDHLLMEEGLGVAVEILFQRACGLVVYITLERA